MKIKAFSIIETIISLIITAIIISIVFVLFSILSDRLLDIKSQNQYSNDLNRLSYAIHNDMYSNEKITNTDSTFTFIHYNQKDTVNYFIRDSVLLRVKNTFTDSMFIKIKSFKIDSIENKKNRFIKMKISINRNDTDFDLNFYKKINYSSTINNLSEKDGY